MIRAVVFDFDGVIANSEPLHFRAYRDVLVERGLTLTERDYYDRYLGYDDIGAFRAIAGDNGTTFTDADIADLEARKAVHLEALEKAQSVLFPGAREAILRMAAAYPVAIASGALKPEIFRVLDHEELRHVFPIVVSAEDTPASKPDPAPYLRAVELLKALVPGLVPAECVAIEDSVWGLQSARTGGLHTVAIAHTYPAADLVAHAEATIEHLDSFTPELVENLVR